MTDLPIGSADVGYDQRTSIMHVYLRCLATAQLLKNKLLKDEKNAYHGFFDEEMFYTFFSILYSLTKRSVTDDKLGDPADKKVVDAIQAWDDRIIAIRRAKKQVGPRTLWDGLQLFSLYTVVLEERQIIKKLDNR
jgi:hypothetical protein